MVATGLQGEKVKELRERRAIERRELAALAGVGYTTIYKIETKDHKPRLSTVRTLAKILKVSPEELLLPDENGN